MISKMMAGKCATGSKAHMPGLGREMVDSQRGDGLGDGRLALIVFRIVLRVLGN